MSIELSNGKAESEPEILGVVDPCLVKPSSTLFGRASRVNVRTHLYFHLVPPPMAQNIAAEVFQRMIFNILLVPQASQRSLKPKHHPIEDRQMSYHALRDFQHVRLVCRVIVDYRAQAPIKSSTGDFRSWDMGTASAVKGAIVCRHLFLFISRPESAQ
ncbi:hypothetical protein SISSUDRAFT_1062732 [Sistotremastrum suecicum HHB10207 ss-3]|uniref:Uncharacterized protein n=1 Tax=Sistotremastrum suecicum HHB10207 ss-3 TaxID=1314776 RepID=A0A166CKT0_9AGAM|nr:hypothetical protein SISSUDRAFT_1062732 [Sistotremastrum suecicum HHB10207 ss-3]